MIELHKITLLVSVDAERDDNPESWDWRTLTDSIYAVPVGASEKVAEFKDGDALYEAIDASAGIFAPKVTR